MTGVRKHSVSIRGHRTSVSLEPAFFQELERIARRRKIALAALVSEVDDERRGAGNLSSALRLLVLDDLKRQAARAPG